MTLAHPTRHRSDTQLSCWFVARNPGTRHTFADSRSLAPPTLGVYGTVSDFFSAPSSDTRSKTIDFLPPL